MNANTVSKTEAAHPPKLKQSDDPRFLKIYSDILNGVFSQYEIYGAPDEENQYHFGEDGKFSVSATKWPDDDFVPGRHEAEEYRIACLVDRALWAAQCAYLAMLKADADAEPDEVAQFNATVNHETNN